MQYWGMTDKGMVRSMNQDTFFTGPVGILNGNEALLLVVCDGMGGAKAGDLASATACETFVASVRQALMDGTAVPQDVLLSAAELANNSVVAKAEESDEYRGMGTTLVAALVYGEQAVVANIGDSRCYHIRNNEIRQVTKDHSLVEDMVDRGELSREAAWRHPRKNLITRAVGTESRVECDLFEIELCGGEELLLCSDGLSNIVNSQEMLFEVLYGESKETAVQRMMDIALGRNASDNVTIVLLSK